MVTKYDNLFFIHKTYRLQLEWCIIELKQSLQNGNGCNIYTHTHIKKDTMNGYVYVEKYLNF
jgi:hypothetical protein